jgi:hypothetical protein
LLRAIPSLAHVRLKKKNQDDGVGVTKNGSAIKLQKSSTAQVQKEFSEVPIRKLTYSC